MIFVPGLPLAPRCRSGNLGTSPGCNGADGHVPEGVSPHTRALLGFLGALGERVRERELAARLRAAVPWLCLA